MRCGIMGVFGFVTAVDKVKELQKKTGKPYNECSSALQLADGDVNQALAILRKYPDQSKRLR